MSELKTSFLSMRVKPCDKALWVKASKGDKLVNWAIRKLNKAAREDLRWKQ